MFCFLLARLTSLKRAMSLTRVALLKFGWICKAKLGTLDEDQKVIGDVLFDGVGEEVT